MQSVLNIEIKKIKNGVTMKWNNTISGKIQTEFFNDYNEIFKKFSDEMKYLEVT
jgi:hypothetical protein